MTSNQQRYLEDLIDRIPGLAVVDYERYAALDKETAGRILLSLTTGGDVAAEFPEIFVWEHEGSQGEQL